MFISVILTAYNRRAFITDALRSVLDQSLDRKYWELIVVKNYSDETIDSLLVENNYKNIEMGGTIGEFLYEGIKNSNGNIISFLDDDDLFLKDKLAHIYNLFSQNHKLVFYHNNSLICSSDLATKEKSRITKNPAFNLSSVNIRKSAINLDNLRKVRTTQDVYMLISAKENGGKIKIGKRVETYYRVNNESTQTSRFVNFDEYLVNKFNVLKPSYEQLLEFSIFFFGRKARRALRKYQLASYSYLLLFSGSKRVKLEVYLEAITLIPSFFYKGGISTLLNFLIYIMPNYFSRKYIFHLYKREYKYQK